MHPNFPLDNSVELRIKDRAHGHYWVCNLRGDMTRTTGLFGRQQAHGHECRGVTSPASSENDWIFYTLQTDWPVKTSMLICGYSEDL